MKTVKGLLEIEYRINPESPWYQLRPLPENRSIEQGRDELEKCRAKRPIISCEYRLVYVRVETTREILD